jgi:thiol-disulfide isomerase/thioredoxin
MNRKTLLYVTLGVVILAVIVAVGMASRNVVPNAASQAPTQSTIKVGQVAPEFAVQTNAGPFDLATVPTPVLLEVFATWCPHCQHETTILNDLAAKYQGKLAMVAVDGSQYAMDGSSAGSESDVNQFGARFAVRYPIAFDPQLAVAQEYLQGGFPTLVLIRPDKKIAWIRDGEVPETDLVKAINAVIPRV